MFIIKVKLKLSAFKKRGRGGNMYKKLLSLFVGVLFVVSVLISALVATGNQGLIGLETLFNNNPNQNNTDNDNPTDNPTDNPGNNTGTNPDKEPSKGPKLTCYDFIDQSLQADGFKYLEGTYWSRGEKNFFILDISKQEFYLADIYNTNVLSDDWYKTEFDRYYKYIYRHKSGEVSVYDILTISQSQLADPNHNFYEFPRWMNHYVAQAEKYGCPLNEISEDKLLGEYKTKMSKASAEDVLSSFDLTSNDGVIRYFKDAYTEGRVQEHTRYKELSSLEEYAALYDNGAPFEAYYMTNIIYKNPEKLVFERDRNGLAGSALEHFVKDVVYPNTNDPANGRKIPTIGVYFIYADNPNFKYIYSAPSKTSTFSNVHSGNDLSKFIMPYDATTVYANKGVGGIYEIYPYGVGFLPKVFEQYLGFVKNLNPLVNFSDDFIRNYTRPFDTRWQMEMGLEDFLDAKFGLINRDVKYLH